MSTIYYNGAEHNLLCTYYNGITPKYYMDQQGQMAECGDAAFIKAWSPNYNRNIYNNVIFVTNSNKTEIVTNTKNTHYNVTSIGHETYQVSYKDSIYGYVQKICCTTSLPLFTNAYRLFYCFYNCNYIYNLKNDWFDYCKNMYMAFYYMYNYRNSSVCGLRTENLAEAYAGCHNMTGSPVCKDNVIDMYNSYSECWNITGKAACGNNVDNMARAYFNCGNLTSFEIRHNVTNLYYAFFNCYRLKGTPNYPNTVVNIYGAFMNCNNLTGDAILRNNIYAQYAFFNCTNLDGNVILTGPNRPISYSYAFNNCNNIKGVFFNIINCYYFGRPFLKSSGLDYINIKNIGIGSMVEDMSYFMNDFTEFKCSNIYGDFSNVNNLCYAFFNDSNATFMPFCGDNVDNMIYAYYNCVQIQGNAVSGKQVTNMYYTYYNCYNLHGYPECGDNVINLSYAFWNCQNLIGSPKCGENVVNMHMAYRNCHNITGNANIGNCVKFMDYAYWNCISLNGYAIIKNNVTNYYMTYANCNNINGVWVDKESVDNFYQRISANSNWSNVKKIYISPNVKNMYQFMDNAFSVGEVNILGSINQVTNISYAFRNCINLKCCIPQFPNTTSLIHAFKDCQNIYGDAIYSENCNQMYQAYLNCYNLNGNAIFPPNVLCDNLNDCYLRCNNITGIKLYGAEKPYVYRGFFEYGNYSNYTDLSNVKYIYIDNSVINTYYAFYNCQTLNLACGITGGYGLVNIAYMFRNCNINFVPTFYQWNKYNNIAFCYYGCNNAPSGDIYLYSSIVDNIYYCFYGHNNQNIFRIHVPASSTTNSCLNINGSQLTGNSCTWTQDALNRCYYNTKENIYVYYDL